MPFKHTSKFQSKDDLRKMIQDRDNQIKSQKNEIWRLKLLLEEDDSGAKKYLSCDACGELLAINVGGTTSKDRKVQSLHNYTGRFDTFKKCGEMTRNYHFCHMCRYDSLCQMNIENLLHGESQPIGENKKTYYRLKCYKKPIEPENMGSQAWSEWHLRDNKYQWDDKDDWIDIRKCPRYMKAIVIIQKMIRGNNQRWKCPIFTFKD